MEITRIIALILALTAPLTLTACGDDDVDEVEIEDGEVETDD